MCIHIAKLLNSSVNTDESVRIYIFIHYIFISTVYTLYYCHYLLIVSTIESISYNYIHFYLFIIFFIIFHIIIAIIIK